MKRPVLAVAIALPLLALGGVIAITQANRPPSLTSSSPVSATTDRPDPARTGAAPGPLRSVGELTLEQDGEVLQDVKVSGGLTIRADNVTLRNVWVETSDYSVVMNFGRHTRIENSTIKGTAGSQAAIADFDDGYFSGSHLDISGAADGVGMGSGSRLASSLIHSLGRGPDTHNDAIEVSGARDVVITNNVILNEGGQTSCMMLDDFSGDGAAGVVIQGNLLAGGGYTIYGGAPVTGVIVEDNQFSTRYFSKAGYQGAGDVLDPSRERLAWEHLG